MKNYTDRMNTLNANGIDTSKYFNVMISKETPKGTTFTITIGENGEPQVNLEQVKGILNQIENEGYVKNNKLFRRWVMAQTFRMLKHPKGWAFALNERGYQYQWDVLENELHAMSKLEREDKELFEERKVFFTKEVILAMLSDYTEKLDENFKYYSHGYREEKIATGCAIALTATYEITKARNYTDYYNAIKKFNNYVKINRVKLDKASSHCKEWVNAFKGAGAYYTLQNLFMFHLPIIKLPEGVEVNRDTAKSFLNMKRMGYAETGEWWKMFGYMKDVIRLNNFDFYRTMYDKYNK